MDFEELLDYKKLYAYIKKRIIPRKDMYVFLDEVQKVYNYENVVDSLFIQENIDVYISGSNSYLFSGQFATNLRGSYIELSMLPFSFKEFYESFPGDRTIRFNEYMEYGGFPYLVNLDHFSHSMLEQTTFEREIKPFTKINDNYEKIILTLDTFSTGNYNGIKVINVIDWLLDEI